MACNLQAIATNRSVNSSVINITRMYESRPQSVALGIIQRDGSVSWRSLPFLFQHDSCLVPGVRENNRLNTSQGLQVHPGRRCCVDPAIACRNPNTGLRILSAVPALPVQECRPLGPAHPKRTVPSLPISALMMRVDGPLSLGRLGFTKEALSRYPGLVEERLVAFTRVA